MSRSIAVWLFRILMVASMPIVLPVVVLIAAGRELRHAAVMTWLEIRMEWASLVAMLRNPPIKGGDRA